MSAKTQQFQSSGSNLRATIQQSINMIRGKDISNYTLVFIDPTIKSQAGSHENIFMPHITLGRGKKCHIRYAETYGTVSREHASISSDGNNVFINHNPSAKNPTLVNGSPIMAACPLKNGDEIQLSYDGPRLRFNTSKVKTSTIGLTSRIGGAVSQAVKPYKTALSVLALLLVVALGFAGYNVYQNSQLNKKLLDSQLVIEALSVEAQSTNEEIQRLKKQGKTNSQRYRSLLRQKIEQDKQIRELKNNPQNVAKYTANQTSSGTVEYTYNKNTAPLSEKDKEKRVDVGKFRGEKTDEVIDNNNNQKIDNNLLPKEDVVFILGKRIEVSYNGRMEYLGVKEFYPFDQDNPQFENRDGIIFGSGFYTDNKELITARHVVQPWRFVNFNDNSPENDIWKELNVLEANGATITMYFDVLSNYGKDHAFDSRQVYFDQSKDRIVEIPKKKKFKIKTLPKRKKGFKKFKKVEKRYKTPTENFSDWAKVRYDNVASSKIKADRVKSQVLKTGTNVYVLGFSHANQLQSARRNLEPAKSTVEVSQDYTLDGEIHVSGLSYGPGSSGGPALIWYNNKFIAVGVVSKGLGSSDGIIVALQNVR